MAFVAFVIGALAQFGFGTALKGYSWIVFAAAAALLIYATRLDPDGGIPGKLSRGVTCPWGPASHAVVLVLCGPDRASRSGGACPLQQRRKFALGVAPPHIEHLEFPGHLRPLRSHQRHYPARHGPAESLKEIFPIIAVLCLAGFARFWQLNSFPQGTWTDEAVNGLYARQMLDDPQYRPVYVPETRLPAHFIYLIAGAFRLGGVSTLTMRMLVAAISLATVILAYLLFRRWFGNGIALVAAAFLGVMRYDLTFSRFALHGITTPFFEILVLYLFDRALDRRRLPDFAWFGLALGFSLAFYHPLRLLPIVLVIFLIALLVHEMARQGARQAFARYIGSLKWHWLVAVLGLLLALAPVLQFAIRSPELFFERANTASIFVKRDEPNLGVALWNNTQKHLQMFNVRGDANGRHNLPNAPMLDPVMGILFVLGFGLALWRWRQPLNLLMLLLFAIMLLGGILSLDFEAPQSLRSIGVIPALVYFMILPIAALLARVQSALAPASRGRQGRKGRRSAFVFNSISGVVLVGLIAVVTDLNFVDFFDKQQNDRGAWAAYSTAETIVARELTRNAADYDFLVSALYDQNPTTRFLAGDVKNVQRWTVMDRLPAFDDASGRGQILLVDKLLESAYHEAIRLYPLATVVEHKPPAGGDTLVYEVIMPATQLQALHGAMARYFAGAAPGSSPSKQQSQDNLSLDWSATQPLPDLFVAQLQSTIDAPDFGAYRFQLAGALQATLLIDGYPVDSGPVELARGLHDLRINVQGGVGSLDVRWRPPGKSEFVSVPASALFLPPVTNAGLRGEYYPSRDWSGAPELVQLDPQLEYYFHVTPLKRPYSVQWSGAVFATEPGSYAFALYSIDGSLLSLDGDQVVANPDGGSTTEAAVQLSAGWHQIRVRFTDKTGGTRMYLYWTPPGATEREIIPARYLRPPMAEYPSTP